MRDLFSTHHARLILHLLLNLRCSLDDKLHGGGVLAQLVGGSHVINAGVCARHVLDHKRHSLIVFVQEPKKKRLVSIIHILFVYGDAVWSLELRSISS